MAKRKIVKITLNQECPAAHLKVAEHLFSPYHKPKWDYYPRAEGYKVLGYDKKCPDEAGRTKVGEPLNKGGDSRPDVESLFHVKDRGRVVA
jgi:hypothetical protein